MTSTAVTVVYEKESEPVRRVASAMVNKNSVNSYYQLQTTPEEGNIGAVPDGAVAEHQGNEQTAVSLNLNSTHTGDHLCNSHNDFKKFYAPSTGRSACKAPFAAGNSVKSKAVPHPALTKRRRTSKSSVPNLSMVQKQA